MLLLHDGTLYSLDIDISLVIRTDHIYTDEPLLLYGYIEIYIYMCVCVCVRVAQ